MSGENPLNLRDEALPHESQVSVFENERSGGLEPFVTGESEMGGSLVARDNLVLHGILGRLLASASRQARSAEGGPNHERSSATSPTPLSRFDVRSFNREELLALVSNAMSHSTTPGEGVVTRFADLCVDFSKMEVSRPSGEKVVLTAKEFKVLRFFLLHPNRVISRDELLNEVWGYECYPTTRTVDNHILKLRHKLEVNPSQPVHFLTVHCVGYKFVP